MNKTFLLVLIFAISCTTMGQKSYEKEWKEVESLTRKGLPQSALKIVDSIYLDAKTDNNAPQFLKAALYQIKLRADYQEDYMENSITQISKEIQSSREPVTQILHSVQAELYWRYYKGNRNKFMDRTVISNPDPGDIRTWDMKTLVNEVSKHYLASLEEASKLQQVRLDGFDPILQTETGSKVYRPTLYDFLAFRAADFFRNEEPGITMPAAGFLFDREEYYAPAREFASSSLPSEYSDDFKYHALTIYRELVKFHLNDREPAALIDADLARIKFVNENSILENKDELYLGALQNLKKTYPDDLMAAEVAYEIALEHQRRGQKYDPFQPETNRWELKTAKEICEQAISRYPGSNGAQNCATLLRDITAPVLSFTMNYAGLPGKPFLAGLNFKSVKTVYFRIAKVDPSEDRLNRQKEREEALAERYRTLPAVKQWTLTLPDEGDFQKHTADIRIPALPQGYYVILASENADFSYEEKGTAFATFWMSNISYISRIKQEEGKLEIFVLDRDKGTSLKNAAVKAFSREYDYPSRSYVNRPVGSYTTDESGYAEIVSAGNNSRSFYLEFSLGDDLFFTENYFYLYPSRPDDKTRINTHFFTDRSIYRPGQTVYFKGIVLETTGDKTVIKPDFTSVVTFHDANGQKVSELAMTTNAFGSFNGTFTAPTGGLTGEMTIRNETGSIGFAVEEYKRPRFKVEINPLEGSYKLNETVNVTGTAMNYNGSAVDQAEVRYRVVRSVRFPVWRSWWRWFPEMPEKEITSGMTTTGADGTFSISFTAMPDLQADKKRQPVFNYRVYADVADITGEVRSAETNVSVGYQAMLVKVDLPDEVNLAGENAFRLTATNLNGRPVKAEGKLILYLMDAPERLIRERSWGRPDVFLTEKEAFLQAFPFELYDNEDDPETWTRKDMIVEKTFNTETDSIFKFDDLEQMSEGEYLLVLETIDAFGEKIETKNYFTLFNPSGKSMPNFDPFWHVMLKNEGEPGDVASLVVGTAEQNVKLIYETELDGKVISRQWIALSGEKKKLDIMIKEEYRGNFFINLAFVKGNRSYQVSEKITVPHTDKQLKITAETFRDKIIPGKEEEWKLRITGMRGEKVAAELLASMYDASLDAFRDHSWYFDLYRYRYSAGNWQVTNAFSQVNSSFVSRRPDRDQFPVTRNYDRLNWFGFEYYGSPSLRGGMLGRPMSNAMMEMDGKAADVTALEKTAEAEEVMTTDEITQEAPAVTAPDQPVRTNFNETAFFFPALATDENGDVILKFTVPESLTEWKMMALAYTKDLKTGMLVKNAVSSKELMVMTNAPRFFREGDLLLFSSKLVSLSEQNLSGQITAEFFDAYTMKSLDVTLGNTSGSRSFTVEKGKSQVFFWEIRIPEGVMAVVCRVRASSGEFADGEEVVVPVLSNRMLVTETLPMPVSKKGTKNFKFTKLIESSASSTIKNYRLTLEFTSNPAWYAVQALPYLVETTHESADGIFARYYANTLASWIANSNPKIKQVFENWKNLTPDALLSNLEKNQELKSVLLNETPWVMQARNETERKQRIALLFDLNRMATEQKSALARLRQLQTANGAWTWFEGMPESRYITQQIVTGIGKLEYAGVIELQREPGLIGMVQQAFRYLDNRIGEDYNEILKNNRDRMDEDHLSPTQVQYLYAYSFLKEYVKINPNNREAYEYFRGQAAKYWLSRNKYLQGMIAVALNRLEVAEAPAAIMRSLKENALYSDEMGMYWREPEGYSWYEAPVERQAMLIEAFTEVAKDPESVELMKIWLLKQKQTQDWKTSRATADAVYALLLRGTDLLASDQLVEVTLGEEKIDPLNLDGVVVEAGTGYFQLTKSGSEITPLMGNVKVVKKDEGVAWGAVYWQYYEDLDRITPAASPLSLERELYVEKNTPSGPVLEPVLDNKILKTGDRVVSRIIIRVDRDLEYVHMKDMRAAAFEPVNSLSGYRYQGGLGYYESIRDASVNFYFDYLRKGTYVFEYKLNATQKGEFSNGITSIQCLYAPEFAAHAQGVRVTVE